MTIYKYLDVSIGHITRRDSEQLSDLDVIRDLPFTVAEYDVGFFIGVPQEVLAAIETIAGKSLSLAFFTLMIHAREQGCDVIRLDGDADTIEGLDVFNW